MAESTSTTEQYKVNIPAGKSGNVEIEKHTVTAQDAKLYRMRAAINGHNRYSPEGTYTGLRIDGELMMSDTPDEVRDHLSFILSAHGDVFIAGLGLGMVAQAVAKKQNVKSVTVVEINKHVIKLVAGHLDQKIQIVQADVFKYQPEMKFDKLWMDIWLDLCTDNLSEMTALRKLYRKYTKSGRVSDIECWGMELLKARRGF